MQHMLDLRLANKQARSLSYEWSTILVLVVVAVVEVVARVVVVAVVEIVGWFGGMQKSWLYGAWQQLPRTFSEIKLLEDRATNKAGASSGWMRWHTCSHSTHSCVAGCCVSCISHICTTCASLLAPAPCVSTMSRNAKLRGSSPFSIIGHYAVVMDVCLLTRNRSSKWTKRASKSTTARDNITVAVISVW